MPTYDYRCPNGHTFELFHGIKDDTPKHCPVCNEVGERVPSGGGGLLFKGSGFYITDYRSKSYKDRAKQDKGGSGGGSEGGGGSGSSGSSGGSGSSGSSGSSSGSGSSESKGSSGGTKPGGSGNTSGAG
jgi:putative FmdB family regulatory protein